MLKKLIGLFSAGAFALVLVTSVQADVLKNAYLTMGSSISGAAGTTHTFRFYHPTATFNSFQALYCTTASGTCTATDIDTQTSGAEGTTTRAAVDVSGSWEPVFTTNGTIRTALTAGSGLGDAAFVFGFTGIDNPTLAGSNCATVAGTSTETCYVRVNTYTDTGYSAAADSSVLSMTITQNVTVSATVDPSFSLIIAGVTDLGATPTANGTTLTTGITPTVTTLPFGNLQPATPKFIAQSATVTTNATQGYSIDVVMAGNMTGNAYADDIDPFVGNAASFTASQSWATPTGTSSGTNTGWLGVGTNDTDVTNQGANQFFSLGTTATRVATHSTSVSALTNIFVFGIEVNAYQEADSYTGTMRYNALPVY